ncbi:prenyltransferase/squalene oxidase repeat-containing protein [Nocardia wallacei]|uniref:Squalene cyclase C-terminal domain-containing protein n=1 Tax=Nocardia wallacei TaxID=480035 RepID=A0A7G1KMJ0_9NOCA|nr:prenyltransferase/squalene oxidase repeat-containing protein [Nocardia wallacei]BCK56270.1 hypothetical protein NWFMUON74_40420 [Nocardia wallacei]
MTLADNGNADTALRILGDSLADPNGSITPAIYDTAQAALLAADIRPPGGIEFTLAAQRPDGSWGTSAAPVPYRVVPTLAATTALLTIARRRPSPAVRRAAIDGVQFLIGSRCLEEPSSLPDTVAIETIVPAQLALLAELFSTPGADTTAGISAGLARAVAACATWTSGLHRLRTAARAGAPLPPHIGHTMEVLGPTIAASINRHSDDGPVACSPAATAAVLAGTTLKLPEAQRYLHDLALRHGGGLPNLSPIVNFERVWIAAQLTAAGIALPRALRTAVAALGHGLSRNGGLGMAPGFPPDCDITASTVTVLRRCGFDTDPQILSRYESDSACFTYYAGERHPSPTVNAHVLDALGHLSDSPVMRRIADKSVAFLIDSHDASGSWTDKWHASPYYSASRCAPALARHAEDAAGHVIARTVRWVLDTQRPDGSWGVWAGTMEETAYAIQTLIWAAKDLPARDRAIRTGTRYLRDRLHDLQGFGDSHPPLWHGKELFTPHRIVNATIHATLHSAARWSNDPAATH